MKSFSLLSLLILVSCASGDHRDEPSIPLDKVNSSSFKKEAPVSMSEVKDFYPSNTSATSPALQDETLDRYTADELAKLSDSNDPLFELSLRCAKRDFDRAFGVASKIFNRYQKIPSYWNQVANCHLNQGSTRKALLFYNKALEVSPGYVPALNNIGVLYSRQGEDQKALLAFEKANKQSRFAKTPRFNLAKLYLTYGLADSALPLFTGLLGDAPSDVGLLNAVANCHFLMSDYQRAMSFYQKIPQEHWSNPEIGINLAVTLKKIGKADQANSVLSSVDSPKSNELKQYHATVTQYMGGKQ